MRANLYISLCMEILNDILANYDNLEIVTLDNGDVQITIHKNNRLNEIKQELDTIDNDLFIAAASFFKTYDPEHFSIFQEQISDCTDENLLEENYLRFKSALAKAAQDEVANLKSSINSAEDRINELQTKYLK